MKINRFPLLAAFPIPGFTAAIRNLLAALILFFLATNLQAARLPEAEQPFQAAFVAPEAGNFPLWGVAAWLGIGAALGWLLLSASVGLMVRHGRSRVSARK